MKKLYVCAGMYRSGSTYQYNVVRVVLEQMYGVDDVYCSFIDQYDKNNIKPIHLVKVHKFKQELALKADLIFVSSRKIEDIKASMLRRAEYLKQQPDSRFANEANVAGFNKKYNEFKKWLEIANFEQKFYMIKDDSKLIDKYTNIIDASNVISINVINQLKAEMKVPEIGYCKKTLLHAGHITKQL